MPNHPLADSVLSAAHRLDWVNEQKHHVPVTESIQNCIDSSPAFIEQVYQQLLESISLGHMRPGERVRQSVLAERLGVSRQPVSHALQLLKHQGLVRDVGKQGVEVTPVDPDYIVQLYEARTSLESRAAGLAAARVRHGIVTGGELQALQQALADGRAACAKAVALPTLVRADARFHSAIYRLSGNRAISHMMEGQWPHLMRSMVAVLDDPGVPTRAWEEHALIAESIIAGDGEASALRATRHLHRAGVDLHRRLRGEVAPDEKTALAASFGSALAADGI